MSIIYGNPIISNGGGVKLNIDYGSTPPTDTTKLWVPLAKKPSAVECSPVLNYGNEYTETKNWTVGFSQLRNDYPQMCSYGNYIYSVCPYIGSQQNDIYRYDVTTGERTTFYSDLVYQNYVLAFTVGKYIYTFNHTVGADSEYVDKFDLETGEKTTLRNVSYPFPGSQVHYFSSGCVSGNKIFLVGSFVGSINSATVSVFDVTTEKFTYHGSMPNQAQGTYNAACVAVGSKVYVFGGTTRVSFDPRKSIQTFDVDTQEYTQNNNVLPYMVNQANRCCRIGSYAYIFGNIESTQYQKKIIRVNLDNLAVDVLESELHASRVSACCGFVGDKFYLLGGSEVSSVETFTQSTVLQQNHLFLQADFGFDNPFPIISDKNTKITAYLRQAYLGDSNNIAQLTNAYLYDSKDLKWKSLSGESYVADMQNALNILGVN
jgi:hypothetical protein